MPIKSERRTSSFRRTGAALSGFKGGASLFSGKGVKFGITIGGHKQLISKITKYKKDTSLKMYDAMKRGVLIVEAEAKYLIVHGYYQPAVKTGRLLGSVSGEIVSYDVKSVEGRIGTPVYYGIYVHEGTHLMKKRKFLVDALGKNRLRLVSMMSAAIKYDVRATSLT